LNISGDYPKNKDSISFVSIFEHYKITGPLLLICELKLRKASIRPYNKDDYKEQ